MREFMFRGKPKNKADYELIKSMYSDNCKDGFIYGSLIVGHGKYYICVTALCQLNSLVNNGMTTMFEVIPETVGEYTTLTDKNNRMIFEGDIVSLKHFENFYAVTFHQGEFTFDNHGDWYAMSWFLAHNIEVIGNIFDNPELLEMIEL